MADTWTDRSAAHRGRPRFRRRHVRVVLGWFWLLDAALQAQPSRFHPEWWRDELAQSIMGQPTPVAHSILWAVNLIASHAVLWNGCFVAVQAVLGVSLVTGRFERAAILASIPWALGIWWVGEGFGTLATGFGLFAAGAPGPVLFYPLLGLLAWPQTRRREPGTAEPSIRHSRGAGCWAALWIGGAVLQLPWGLSPGRVLQANIEEYSLGQPAWLTTITSHAYALAGAHPGVLVTLLVIAEAVVGIGVAFRRSRRPALLAGMVLAAVFWVVFQDFGTLFGGGATDPGAAPLLVLLGVALWFHPGQVGPVPSSPLRWAESASPPDPDRALV